MRKLRKPIQWAKESSLLTEGTFYQNVETPKKRTKQILELKDTVTELKNSLEGINIRLGQAEERIGDFKTVHLKLLIQRNEMKKDEKWKKP